MKKYLLAALILLINLAAFSQRGEKIRTLKIGYLTEQLHLDPQTAEKFWPLYRQYEDELGAVVNEKKMNQNETRSAYEILDQEQKALDIKKKYSTLFSRVISNDQLNQLYKSEKDFRQMVINRSLQKETRRENMQQGGPNPGRNNGRMNAEPRPRMEQRQQMRNNEQTQPLLNRPANPSRPQRDNNAVGTRRSSR